MVQHIQTDSDKTNGLTDNLKWVRDMPTIIELDMKEYYWFEGELLHYKAKLYYMMT